MQHPYISIIVPNYCYASYLPQRLETIFNQTYSHFEVIILDDCSLDNSREVIEHYRSNPKVSHIVYSETNSGSPFVQWSKGIDLAKGEYIWIAEADDFADIHFLERLILRIGDNNNVVIAYSNIVFVDMAGIPYDDALQNCNHNLPSTHAFYTSNEFIRERMVRMNGIINASSAIFKRQAVLNIPTDYMSFKAAGDYLFWVYIAEQGDVVKIDEPLDFFRQHGNNITPNSYKTGDTHIELYSIFSYIRKKHMGFKDGFEQYLLNLENIKYHCDFSPEVKSRILRVWDPYHLSNSRVMSLCWKVLKRFQ